MSTLTIKPLKLIPSASAGVTLSAPTQDTYGAWVEVMASAPAALQIAGMILNPNGNRSSVVELAIGAVGVEQSIGKFAHGWNSISNSPCVSMLPIPVDAVPAGSRISARLITNTSLMTLSLTLLYYEALESDYKISTAYGHTPTTPLAGVSLTASTTAWANVTYAELTAGFSVDTYLLGITITQNFAAHTAGEIDLAIGSAGAEEVLTTLSTPCRTQGIGQYWLPAPYPVGANKRISFRGRSANTTAAKSWQVVLISAPVPVIGSGAGTGIWMGDSGGSVWVE